ncbi:MAG TPA: alcohol dehydrogenase catalytic domain-containing protein, partial [Longimicrobium sp.]|nr:alcohol dehydrogenase catalytic domain-containing protein [Longimicrobium sp.]
MPPGHALVRIAAAGLNFADVYRRRGNYHLAGTPPWILGYEGAGTVVSGGDGPIRPGMRVGFADSPHANAELAAVPVDRL